MKKDKLIHEFANLKIENASKVLGGEEGGRMCERKKWKATYESNGSFHMDPDGVKYIVDFDQPIDSIPAPAPNDTIPAN